MTVDEINRLCHRLEQRGLVGANVTVTGVEENGKMSVDLMTVEGTPEQWAALLQPPALIPSQVEWLTKHLHQLSILTDALEADPDERLNSADGANWARRLRDELQEWLTKEGRA